METIGIGKLAKRAGVSIDTVRYYEKSGLLSPQARLPSGYRRYGDLAGGAAALHPPCPGTGVFTQGHRRAARPLRTSATLRASSAAPSASSTKWKSASRR